MNTLSLYVQRNGEVISADSRSLISKRYCTVTSAMNREFCNITSDRQNSIYVGSYGRGTAIDNYFRSYHLSGIVIDSFVYQAIGNWRWLSSGESSTSAAGTYERILLDCYNQHFMWGAMPLSAPGSNQQVSTDNSRDCLGKVLRYIAD